MARGHSFGFFAAFVVAGLVVSIATFLILRRSARPDVDVGSGRHVPAIANAATAEGLAPSKVRSRSPVVLDDTASRLCELFGEVRSESREESPFPKGFTARLISDNGQSREITISNSEYSFTGLDVGTWWICVAPPGWKSVCHKVVFDHHAQRVRCDLHLDRSPIIEVGVWAADGRPLSRVAPDLGEQLVPVATEQPLGDSFPWRSGTRANPLGVGRFRPSETADRENGRIGTVVLNVDPPLWLSLTLEQRVIDSTTVGAHQSAVEFTVDEEALRGLFGELGLRVVGSDQTSLPGATVVLASSDLTRARTDNTGRVLIDELMPGEYWLTVKSAGLAINKRRVRIDPGARTDLGDVTMDAGVSVRCTLAGDFSASEGAQGSRSYFVLGKIGSYSSEVDLRDRYGIASTDGRFEFALAPGRYLIRVDGADWVSRSVEFDARTSPVDLTIPVYRPRRLTITLDASEASSAYCRIEDTIGREVLSMPLFRAGPIAVSMPPGSFAISLLDVNGKALDWKRVEIGDSEARVHLAIQ